MGTNGGDRGGSGGLLRLEVMVRSSSQAGEGGSGRPPAQALLEGGVGWGGGRAGPETLNLGPGQGISPANWPDLDTLMPKCLL